MHAGFHPRLIVSSRGQKWEHVRHHLHAEVADAVTPRTSAVDRGFIDEPTLEGTIGVYLPLFKVFVAIHGLSEDGEVFSSLFVSIGQLEIASLDPSDT